MTMTSDRVTAIDTYLTKERADHARMARSYGLVVFNPDTDPDTCERVRNLSDEVIHAEEEERMREFTVEHFAEVTMDGLHTAEKHAGYGQDHSGGF